MEYCSSKEADYFTKVSDLFRSDTKKFLYLKHSNAGKLGGTGEEVEGRGLGHDLHKFEPSRVVQYSTAIGS